ncbi:hypothetical protein BC834DRAFT_832017 [Gloeopeniophorella convolvens]|nr:hypothetical protein BC834DRAFT_832017 [Gloeopeniophorella convolvens]
MALQSRYVEEDLFLAEELSRLVQEAECTFTCDACRLQHPEDRTLSLRPCGHSFCPGCLRAHVICELDDRRFPVHCPACIGLHTNAEHGVVTNATVLELGISDEHYDVWVELEMSPISAVLHCRKCGNSSFVDRRDVEEMPTLQCPLPGCSNAWCKLCQTTIIVGGPRHTCNEPVDAVDHFADLKLLRDRMHQERDHKQLAYQLTHGTCRCRYLNS